MRTTDDSWDVTGSVGATAVAVADVRAAETRRPDALFHDPYAEKLVRAAGSSWRRVLDVEESALGLEDRIYGPLGDFFVARTVYFDTYFRNAIETGIRQAVILAAGLDARSYRLAWPSGMVLFELDQPKVLDFKARALANEVLRVDCRRVGIDLRLNWQSSLIKNGFDNSLPTAWLIEGLLRYLPIEAQDRLFEGIVALSASGSRVALNLVQELPSNPTPTETDAVRIGVENLWYPEEGLKRADPREWYSRQGWTVNTTNSIAILSDCRRPVPAAAEAELCKHVLMTAVSCAIAE